MSICRDILQSVVGDVPNIGVRYTEAPWVMYRIAWVMYRNCVGDGPELAGWGG